MAMSAIWWYNNMSKWNKLHEVHPILMTPCTAVLQQSAGLKVRGMSSI